jgi:hypothetical protein
MKKNRLDFSIISKNADGTATVDYESLIKFKNDCENGVSLLEGSLFIT